MLPIGHLPGHYLACCHWVIADANHNVFNDGGNTSSEILVVDMAQVQNFEKLFLKCLGHFNC